MPAVHHLVPLCPCLPECLCHWTVLEQGRVSRVFQHHMHPVLCRSSDESCRGHCGPPRALMAAALAAPGGPARHPPRARSPEMEQPHAPADERVDERPEHLG
eukprot:1976849-Lingulodinium_polyedra.AAC.1